MLPLNLRHTGVLVDGLDKVHALLIHIIEQGFKFKCRYLKLILVGLDGSTTLAPSRSSSLPISWSVCHHELTEGFLDLEIHDVLVSLLLVTIVREALLE